MSVVKRVKPFSEGETWKWDCVYFGNYCQDGDGSDVKSPIRWRILDRTGNGTLLISDRILDAGKYNNEKKACTWETCDMRRWLNGDFYNAAFSAAEQAAILERDVVNSAFDDFMGAYGGNVTKDVVSLLSYDEILDGGYGFEECNSMEESPSRTTGNTAYAATKPGMYSNTLSADTWWLRGPGYTNNMAIYVRTDGIISKNMPVNSIAGIRPVICVDLSDESLWKKAGTAVAKLLPEDGEINI